MNENIFVRHYNLPHSIRSYVVANRDMSFTIVINSRLSAETQLQAYKHELDHIANGDYDKTGNVSLLELNAHAF